MLQFLSFAVICVLVRLGHGQTSCPANAERRIMECSRLMQGYAQAHSPSARLEHCSDARSGLACMRDVIQECQELEGLPLGELLNSLDHLEEQLNTVCSSTPPTETVTVPNNPGRCTSGAQRKLLKCSNNMQRYASESPIVCSKIGRAIDCMIKQSQKCPNIIEAGTITRIQSLRGNIMQICVEPSDEEEDEDEEAACPENYSMRLQECMQGLSQKMSSIMGNGQPSAQQCREINEDFNCASEIFTGCSAEPGMSGMSSQLGMDRMRGYIESLCPAGATNAGMQGEGPGSDEVTDNDTQQGSEEVATCPAGYTRMLMECVSPMHGLGPGQDIGQKCSIMETGFTCIDGIVAQCPNQPDIEAMLSAMNMNEMRSMISPYCP